MDAFLAIFEGFGRIKKNLFFQENKCCFLPKNLKILFEFLKIGFPKISDFKGKRQTIFTNFSKIESIAHLQTQMRIIAIKLDKNVLSNVKKNIQKFGGN